MYFVIAHNNCANADIIIDIGENARYANVEYRRLPMSISYKKLWKLLIDKDMNKGDLQRMAGISASSIAKLSKGENVQTDILVKICAALECDTCDIMEISNGNNIVNRERQGENG